MAKTASQRRAAKRTQQFAKLAQQSPEQFARLLETNLEGWVAEAKFRARTFTKSDDGKSVLKAFDLVEHAKAQLGDNKSQRVAQVIRTLEHECAKAVAKQMPKCGVHLKKLCC